MARRSGRPGRVDRPGGRSSSSSRTNEAAPCSASVRRRARSPPRRLDRDGGDGRLGGQAAGLRSRGGAVQSVGRRRAAGQRDGRHSQRRDRRRKRKGARHPGMPNTPALIGQGIAGLFARGAVDRCGPRRRRSVLAPTGELIWVGEEVSSTPSRRSRARARPTSFCCSRRCSRRAAQMGLRGAARASCRADLAGSAALAAASPDPPAELRRSRHLAAAGTTEAAEGRRASRAARATPSSPPCLAARAKVQALGGPARRAPIHPSAAVTMSYLSYLSPTATSPWHTYLSQVDRVLPYLGPLARWSKP